MANFFQNLAQHGGFGGAAGAYATNKDFRKGVNEFAFGSKQKFKPFNQDSLQALLSLLQGGGLEGNPTFGAGNNYLQNLLSGSPEAFSAFEAPFKRQFEEETVPMLSERFAGLGTGAGGLNSSGFQNSLAREGGKLSETLAALRGGLQMQALPQAYQYAQGPLQNILQAAGLIPSQYYEIPGQSGALQGILNAFAQGAGKAMSGGF